MTDRNFVILKEVQFNPETYETDFSTRGSLFGTLGYEKIAEIDATSASDAWRLYKAGIERRNIKLQPGKYSVIAKVNFFNKEVYCELKER